MILPIEPPYLLTDRRRRDRRHREAIAIVLHLQPVLLLSQRAEIPLLVLCILAAGRRIQGRGVDRLPRTRAEEGLRGGGAVGVGNSAHLAAIVNGAICLVVGVAAAAAAAALDAPVAARAAAGDVVVVAAVLLQCRRVDEVVVQRERRDVQLVQRTRRYAHVLGGAQASEVRLAHHQQGLDRSH